MTDQNLGAWEDIPARNFDVDATTAQLDSRDAFILTRIDGRMTIEELCTVTGLGERKTLEGLQRLLASGLVLIHEAGQSRRMIHLRTRSRAPAPVAMPEPESYTPSDPKVAAFLAQFRGLGRIPAQSRRGQGQARFGGMKFDRELLREADFLRVEHKKEILFLVQFQNHLDHFEFIGMEPSAEKSDIRRAYFEFSRRFHPDTVFRKEAGPFGEFIEKIFKHGSEVYEILTSNADFRERYCQAIEERNAREAERNADAQAARQQARIGRLKKQSAGRKAQLRERLKKNADARRVEQRTRTVAGRVEKAASFYREGMTQFEGERYVAATNSLRLAVNYDPKNETYIEALATSEEKMRQAKAEQQWKRGFIQESLGHVSEAIQAYLEACEVLPKPTYCAHIVDLFLKYDLDLHKAEELARRAVEGDPSQVDYRILLGRVYQRAKLTKKAASTFEEVLRLDPKNEFAKKALKKLK